MYNHKIYELFWGCLGNGNLDNIHISTDCSSTVFRQISKYIRKLLLETERRMFIFSCTCTKIKPLAQMGLVCASKGGYPSFFHQIYSKFQLASCISNTSSNILYVIYLKFYKNKLTLKIVRLLIQCGR